MRIELTILRHLLHDEDYTRRTLPYLKPEYFQERHEKTIYQEIDKYVTEYNNLQTR